MALTREILVADAALSSLTDEQIGAITQLSQNDENSVIAKKTGEIYGALDADILSASGIEREGIEKTYEYAKRVIGQIKQKADSASGLQSQIDILNQEKLRLEDAIKKGASDTEAVKQLNQAKADLQNVTNLYNELNTKMQGIEDAHKKELFSIQLGSELNAASAGLKFKESLPESVVGVILQQAKDKVKAMNPEFIDNGNGAKILVFKNSDGTILRNSNNKLEPFTPAEILGRELEAMDVLDKGRQASGAGTKTPPAGGNLASVDIQGARTKSEAYETIRTALLAQGMKDGSADFQSAMTKAWKDNNVSNLPS